MSAVLPHEANGEPSEEPKGKCFVVGPIGASDSDERRHSDIFFHEVLEPALTDRYEIVRADHLSEPGNINNQVIKAIVEADLIVADMSFGNPNAFYELGIADSFRKPVVLFCRRADKLPFDKSNDRTVVADIDWYKEKCEAKAQIAEAASSIEKSEFLVSNPVTQAVSRATSFDVNELEKGIEDRVFRKIKRTMYGGPAA